MRIIRVSDLEKGLKPLTWLWPGYIPSGLFTILLGKPGVGKSTLFCELAAHVTSGKPWPNGAECPKGAVMLCECEDGPEIVTARCKAAGADTSNLFVQRHFSKLNPDSLREAIQELNIKLILLSPLDTYLSEVDSSKSNRVRDMLQPYLDVCQQEDASLVGIMHPSKSATLRGSQKVPNSVAYAAMARSILEVIKIEDEPEQFVLQIMKTNLAPKEKGFSYSIGTVAHKLTPDGTSYIIWGKPIIEYTEIIDPDPEEKPMIDSAVAALKEILGLGELDGRFIMKRMDEEGFHARMIYRAAKQLGVIRRGSGQGQDYSNMWRLPLPKSDSPFASVKHEKLDSTLDTSSVDVEVCSIDNQKGEYELENAQSADDENIIM